VLLSHAHHVDNLDDSGVEFIKTIPTVITGKRRSERAGPSARRLGWWESTKLVGEDGFEIEITAVPARHGPFWLPEAWAVNGYVLRWKGQKHGVLYISGDTVRFFGLSSIRKRFQVGTAILHLGAVHFWPPYSPFLRFTFTGAQAARFARRLNPKTIIPLHYERSVWTHLRESQASYHDAFADQGLSSRVRWLEPGRSTAIET
jgi:L-ascorbate metabolism protein UlaG (beta-lactamase superfamily)